MVEGLEDRKRKEVKRRRRRKYDVESGDRKKAR